MSETTEETLARHERQIAALKAALKEHLTDMHNRVQSTMPDGVEVNTTYQQTLRLLDSDE